MKEVLQNAADRERIKIIKYLKDANKALTEESGEENDAVFYLEMIIEALDQHIAGRPLVFRTRDLGL